MILIISKSAVSRAVWTTSSNKELKEAIKNAVFGSFSWDGLLALRINRGSTSEYRREPYVLLHFSKGDAMTVMTMPSNDLLANLNGRLPSTPDEILEALRLGEENIRAGKGVPVEEMIGELERMVAE